MHAINRDPTQKKYSKKRWVQKPDGNLNGIPQAVLPGGAILTPSDYAGRLDRKNYCSQWEPDLVAASVAMVIAHMIFSGMTILVRPSDSLGHSGSNAELLPGLSTWSEGALPVNANKPGSWPLWLRALTYSYVWKSTYRVEKIFWAKPDGLRHGFTLCGEEKAWNRFSNS